MNWKAPKALSQARTVAALGLASALIITSASTGLAQSDESGSKKKPEGTWFVQVTLVDCSTSTPIGPPFNSLVTFHRGGTLSESTSSPAFAIGQRSPGHGNWASQGHHTYSQQMVNLINFDTAPNLPFLPGFDPSLPITPGFFAGWSIVTHTFELTDSDHGSSSGTNAFYRADDPSKPYRTGCSTAVSRRFE